MLAHLLSYVVGVRLTCRHKEDSCAEDDVVARLVELTGGYTQASHEEQDDTEDGEDAGGSHRTWKSAEDGGRERRGKEAKGEWDVIWCSRREENSQRGNRERKRGEMAAASAGMKEVMSIKQRE